MSRFLIYITLAGHVICRNSNKRWSYGSHRWTRPSQPGMKLCFGFCVSNFLSILSGFLLMRETDTNKTEQFCHTSIFNNSLVKQKKKLVFFGQFYYSRIEVLRIGQLLALVIFASVSLVRENLRGLKENLKHKIRT